MHDRGIAKQNGVDENRLAEAADRAGKITSSERTDLPFHRFLSTTILIMSSLNCLICLEELIASKSPHCLPCGK